MSGDPFGNAPSYVPACPDCHARGGGHLIGCEVMAEEVAKRQRARRGVCDRCHLLRPCECDSS